MQDKLTHLPPWAVWWLCNLVLVWTSQPRTRHGESHLLCEPTPGFEAVPLMGESACPKVISQISIRDGYAEISFHIYIYQRPPEIPQGPPHRHLWHKVSIPQPPPPKLPQGANSEVRGVGPGKGRGDKPEHINNGNEGNPKLYNPKIMWRKFDLKDALVVD